MSDDHVSDDHVSELICHACSRESSLYYSHQGEQGSYEYRPVQAPDRKCDGSVYFNYLKLTDRYRNGALQNHDPLRIETGYGPVSHKKSIKQDSSNAEQPKSLTTTKTNKSKQVYAKCNNEVTSPKKCSLFSCCRRTSLTRSNTAVKDRDKQNRDSQTGVYACRSNPCNHQPPSSTLDSSQTTRNINHGRQTSDWSRTKRLLFLFGILFGIMLAAIGIVIGFIILAPTTTGLF